LVWIGFGFGLNRRRRVEKEGRKEGRKTMRLGEEKEGGY
jgi:hypothetical protein